MGAAPRVRGGGMEGMAHPPRVTLSGLGVQAMGRIASRLSEMEGMAHLPRAILVGSRRHRRALNRARRRCRVRVGARRLDAQLA